MSFNNRRSPGIVGRGSISIITLLLALPKLLLLPSLAGAFLAPIGVLSTSAGRFSSLSSAASSPGQDLTAASLRNGRHHQPSHGVGGIFALSGGGSSSDESATDNGNMSPAEAGAAEGTAAAGTPLMSSPSLSGAVGDGGGGDARDGGGTEKGGPAVVNVAKVEASSPQATSTLWNVPNMLTMARVVAIPVFATIFYASLPRRNIWCSAIFAGAAFTDWLDGYIARRQGIVTPFGSFLDPVADKLLVSTALILLSERLGPWMTICSAIILCRELGISALREWMAQLGLRETVKVGNAGKWKTATQMIAISMLLLLEPGAAVTLVNPATFMPIAKALLYVSTVLTVTSGSGYLRAAWPALMGDTK